MFQVLLGRIIYDFSLLVIAILRQGYYLGVATVDYAGSAYRSFGQRVDRMTKFYDRQKLRLTQGRQQAPPAIKKD